MYLVIESEAPVGVDAGSTQLSEPQSNVGKERRRCGEWWELIVTMRGLETSSRPGTAFPTVRGGGGARSVHGMEADPRCSVGGVPVLPVLPVLLLEHNSPPNKRGPNEHCWEARDTQLLSLVDVINVGFLASSQYALGSYQLN